MRYLYVLMILMGAFGGDALGQGPAFKAGVAKVSITPDEPLLLNGYAGRDDPSKGVLLDIWAKALAIEDGSGKRVVFVSTDLLGLSHDIAEEVVRQADSLYGLSKSQVLLNSSHTHSAPMVWPCLDVIYAELSADNQRKLAAYGAQLTAKLVGVIGEALRGLAPAVLSTGHGVADFAINRRNVAHPGGPVDHDVPVVRVVGTDGILKAVLFGYACHNTTLVADNYLINGDYAGFAQAALEAAHPGAVALFLMGCGGDQNPDPRGTAELARRHGRSLADAVEKVLGGSMTTIRSSLRTAYTTVELPYRPFDAAQYRRDLAGDNKYLMRRAKLMLDAYNRGWTPRALTYPVQAVRFGKDLSIVALSDEVVVDYSLRAKKAFSGENLYVAGYSHEVMCYIPSLRVLKEGGYEPDESMIYYGFPGPFADSVEEKVFGAVRTVMRETGAVQKAERADGLRGTMGTYAFPPRKKDGSVDIPVLIAQLKELHANTYHWLAWGKANDIVALEKFLPVAGKENIRVWVTLVPESESPPYQKDYSEPYRLDFGKWAEALARLSVKEPNLVAWSIDDFVHNLKVFTPPCVKEFLTKARAINPRLSFIPCSYYTQITPAFAAAYGELLDGVLFPYRNESVADNLSDATHVESEIASIRKLFRPGFPVFLDVYATEHSSLGSSTSDYVREVIARGRRSADGVLIYCHQDPVRYPEKYKIIGEAFAGMSINAK